jgi:hypothetical protein
VCASRDDDHDDAPVGDAATPSRARLTASRRAATPSSQVSASGVQPVHLLVSWAHGLPSSQAVGVPTHAP